MKSEKRKAKSGKRKAESGKGRNLGRFQGKDILQRSLAFGACVIRLARLLPHDDTARHIANQLVRAATSVGANLHEADMAESVRDFCNKVNIAQKEAGEAGYWLKLIEKSGLSSDQNVTELESTAIELKKYAARL